MFWEIVFTVFISAVFYAMFGFMVMMMLELAEESALRNEAKKAGGVFWTIVLWPFVLVYLILYGFKCLWQAGTASLHNGKTRTNPFKMATSVFRRD